MKRSKTLILLTLLLIACNMAQAQQESFTIELSEPGEVGSLKVDVTDNPIKVVGENRRDVEIVIIDRKNKNRNPSFFFDFLENRNRIYITDRGRAKGIALEIKVPKEFELGIETTFGDEIDISSVSGNIEVNAHEGNITIAGGNGSAVLHTNNGDINATYNALSEKYPSYLSSIHGNVRLVLPTGYGASVIIDSFNKKVDSDFKLELDYSQGRRSYDEGVARKINGGGPRVVLKNFYGRIEIREN